MFMLPYFVRLEGQYALQFKALEEALQNALISSFYACQISGKIFSRKELFAALSTAH
jgi:hypothetical protein